MEADDYMALSLLSQYYYCPRRAGLLMLEQLWSDNEYTAEGVSDHDKAHRSAIEKRGKTIHIYDYAVYSHTLMLTGRCDCVEAHADDDGCILPFADGRHALYPVEYKHGVTRDETEYNVQLCAQAVCLEEMHGIHIDSGAIFYTSSHRRVDVAFDAKLRNMVADGMTALRAMMNDARVPPAHYGKRCKKCSLVDMCAPRVKRSVDGYRDELYALLQEPTA